MSPRVFSSRSRRRRFLAHLAVALALFVLATVVLSPYVDAFRDRREVQRIVGAFGATSPLAFVALHALQTVVVPIPGQVVGIAGGYLYGAFWGTVYTLCGVWLGSYVAFRLARRFGRRYVTATFATDAVERYDATISKLGVAGLTIIVLFPGLPDDVICFVCGTSDLTTRQFLAIVVLGWTPAYVLAVLSGAQFGDEQLYRGLALVLFLAVASALGYLERDRIRRVVEERFGTAR